MRENNKNWDTTYRFNAFNKLTEQEKNFMASTEISEKVQSICQLSGIRNSEEIKIIALTVGDVLLKFISQNEISDQLKQYLKKDKSLIQKITEKIKSEIFLGSLQTSVNNPRADIASMEHLPLSQALQKYPRLGEQLVTGNPIKLKIFPEPVRPSIKNWIAEYHAVLGAGSHGTMERGNFLYHSENGKRLTAGERQKLAVILKSLDENEAIAVDTERQEIVFQAASDSQQATADKISKSQFPISNKIPNSKIQNYFSDKASEVPTISRDSDRSVGTKNDYHFSSPQRLQSERPQPKSYQHFDPYHIDPVGYPEDKPKPPASPNRGEQEPPRPPAPPKPEPRINGNIVDLRN